MNGWVLCPGDGVLIISPGEDYHGLFAKVDTFPTTLELSSYVQIDGRPTTVGRVLVPNAHLRWSGPGLDLLDKMRPTRPGQRVRVVLDNESLATAEMKSLDGQLGEVTELGPISGNNVSMITVKFDDSALLPASIYNYDLLIVPTPVVQYLPEPITSADIEVAVSTPTATTAPVYTPTKMKLVPLADIVVTSNTRKVFDETALAELAESIKAQGVIAPITVRPHAGQPGKFELVAGERRYRASKLAEQVTIPAVIRSLTDREFLEVQLLENLQRVDVRPADEASAFSKLLGSNFSAEEIAQRVGKPVKFVLQRAKLVALIPFWMELLEADRLPLVAAHELARLPAHSQVVVKKWLESSYAWEMKQNKVLDAGTIRHAINQEVLRQLSGAAFPKDDATLLPAAGPCTTCPKNSANCRGLFDEAGTDSEAGKCLDATCFASKKSTFLERRKREISGINMPLISTNYASPPAGALGQKFYDRAKEGDKGAVQALVVDGTDAGAINWVKLSKGAPDAQVVAQDNKAERAATIRANRLKKITNELWAAKLRDTFTAELLDPTAGAGAAHALLDHWLRRSFTFGRTRTPNDLLSYLVGQYSWQEPTETDLDNSWQREGDSPHDQYISRQLAAMPDVLDKVALFFDLKIRDGLDQTEYTAYQSTLVKTLPSDYQATFDVATEAESHVQARYYSKKKEATA
jgi:ParB/RepB/Spo0J family partition protein